MPHHAKLASAGKDLPSPQRAICIPFNHLTTPFKVLELTSLARGNPSTCDTKCRRGDIVLSSQYRSETWISQKTCERSRSRLFICSNSISPSTMPHHPSHHNRLPLSQTNGMTERFNRTLPSMLAMYIFRNQDNWRQIRP